jgi:hypothetical protein
MKDKNLYLCKVPLILKHLYTSPRERTIDESFGSWWVVSKNMTTKMVVLAQSKDENTRMQISLDLLQKHFEIVKQEGLKCVVSRPINGITINGYEYLRNKDDELMVFASKDDAIVFLKQNGCDDMGDIVFLDHDKLIDDEYFEI